MQELVADAAVLADGGGDLLHVGAEHLAQIRHLVDEADLQGEEGVGGIFCELGGLAADEHHRRVAQRERLVQARHQLARALIVDADENAVGMHEVLDRRAFAQELRIGAHGELGVGPDRAHAILDLAAGAHRHRRFGDDDGEAVEVRRQLLDRGVDVGQIRIAIAAAHRRADRQQHDVGSWQPRAPVPC